MLPPAGLNLAIADLSADRLSLLRAMMLIREFKGALIARSDHGFQPLSSGERRLPSVYAPRSHRMINCLAAAGRSHLRSPAVSILVR